MPAAPKKPRNKTCRPLDTIHNYCDFHTPASKDQPVIHRRACSSPDMPHSVIPGLIYFLCGYSDGLRPPSKNEIALTTEELNERARDRVFYGLDEEV